LNTMHVTRRGIT